MSKKVEWSERILSGVVARVIRENPNADREQVVALAREAFDFNQHAELADKAVEDYISQFVQVAMAEHPDWSEDEIARVVVKRIEKATESQI